MKDYIVERNFFLQNIDNLINKGFFSDADIRHYENELTSFYNEFKESNEDPLINFMFIKLMTKNFTDYSAFKKVVDSNHFAKFYRIPSKGNLMICHRQFSAESDGSLLKNAERIESYYNHVVNSKKAKRKARIFGLAFVGALVLFVALNFVAPSIFPWFKNTLILSVDGTELEASAYYNSNFEVDVPNKVGYKFLGFFDKTNLDNQIIDENGHSISKYPYMFENMELVSKFEKITYNLTLDDSFENIEGFLPQTIQIDDCIQNFDVSMFERTGYTFIGLKSNKGILICDETGHIVESKKIFNNDNFALETGDTNIGLLPVWEGIPTTIHFDSKGGNTIQDKEVNYGLSYKLPVPTKENAGFDGWYKGDAKVTDYTGQMLSVWEEIENAELEAKWVEGKFTISFENCNEIPDIEVTYGQEIVLPEPVRYSSDSNGRWFLNGKGYKGGEKYCFLSENNVLFSAVFDEKILPTSNEVAFGAGDNSRAKIKYQDGKETFFEEKVDSGLSKTYLIEHGYKKIKLSISFRGGVYDWGDQTIKLYKNSSTVIKDEADKECYDTVDLSKKQVLSTTWYGHKWKDFIFDISYLNDDNSIIARWSVKDGSQSDTWHLGETHYVFEALE